jgi:hypothetical protein
VVLAQFEVLAKILPGGAVENTKDLSYNSRCLDGDWIWDLPKTTLWRSVRPS